MKQRRSTCVCSTLRMVTRAMTQMYDDALRPSGLRVTQFSILGRLSLLGTATITQLTEVLVMDQTTLTRSVKLLERQGMIVRVAHADARVKALKLTAKGRQALKAAVPLWEEAQGRVFGQIGVEQWATIQDGLFNLLRSTRVKEGDTGNASANPGWDRTMAIG
jgi:DNA-binding MarR family transcriptional regulator